MTPGLPPEWSRTVVIADAGRQSGDPVEVHLLDRPGTGDPLPNPLPNPPPTVVCVHGNPTWSVLWAPLLAGLDPRYRVVAPDQVDMGRSARVTRPGEVRRYRHRIDDLTAILDAADVTGPVVLVGHDWGGAVAAGWAVRHLDRVAGLVLANTGVAVPAGRRAPWLIRLAATGPLRDLVTRRTPLFVRATPWLPGVHLDRATRTALAAPYRRAADRAGVAGFVADIPFDESHPSAADLAEVAAGLGTLTERATPVLLVWGGRDPVFDDSFADDLRERIPHAELHRSPRAGHLSPLEVNLAPVINNWLAAPREPVSPDAVLPDPDPALAPLAARRDDPTIAFHDGATDTSVTFAELWARIHAMAAGLRTAGVGAGDRVAVLVPPGIDLVATVFACWRIGAVTVIADRGLGARGLGAAVRSARVQAVVGIGRALAAARVLRWARGARMLRVETLAQPDDGSVHLGPEPDADNPAAVLFTSGATGPAKGVRYTHRQLCAQRDALRSLYDIGPDDRLVAAFAPFSLFGPALAIPTAIPDVDVTAPATLTATALEAACARVDATLVFASPAALVNVTRTAEGAALPALARVRTVMSAGAPIGVPLLESVRRLTPTATLHTPYGMTEVLPVADTHLDELRAVGPGAGVCVGRPVTGCRVRIDPLGPDDRHGEVLVAAPWCSAGYDRLADTERRARSLDADGTVWHRSGDLGLLDADGRLWIGGRVVHAIHTATGAVAPVPLELAVEAAVETAVETALGARRAAAVGVGPVGVQQVVIVVEHPSRRRSMRLAPPDLTDTVRAALPGTRADTPPVAAVLEMAPFPVDVRHNSKIDRTLLAQLAERLLAGTG